MVDHRVHVAAADREEQSRTSELSPGIAVGPVWLRNDANAKAGGLECSTEYRHRERRVIDVGISGNEHDIDFVPATFFGFLHRHRQPAATGARRHSGPVEHFQACTGFFRFDDWEIHDFGTGIMSF